VPKLAGFWVSPGFMGDLEAFEQDILVAVLLVLGSNHVRFQFLLLIELPLR
jgi:hypothetical protein